MRNPTERFPTSEARASLAARFGLVYADETQDWEWEIAAPERFDEFLDAYSSLSLSDAERFSLLEVLLQCIEDSESPQCAADRWVELKSELITNLKLHLPTIEYWSRMGAARQEEHFRVTPLVRQLLAPASTSE